MQKQYADCFSSYLWHQFPLDRLLRHQTNGPAGKPLRWIAAHHGDNPLFLAAFEQFGRSWSLLFVQSPGKATLFLAMSHLPYCLCGQRNHVGNPRCAQTFRQLQERQGPQHDPDLLHATAQPSPKFFLILPGNLNPKSGATHTQVWAETFPFTNGLYESLQAVRELVSTRRGDGASNIVLFAIDISLGFPRKAAAPRPPLKKEQSR